MEENYYYIFRGMGMKSNGVFTRKQDEWMIFTDAEKYHFEFHNLVPYGATRRGAFVPASKYH
jgi:hypothetical protein